MEKKPTYEQAQLHLQLFEMRRETRLRQARDWFSKNYFADTFDEETTGEFFGVWELVKSHVAQGRERFSNKNFLAHLEKAAQRYETWIESRSPGQIAAMRKMMKEMRSQPAKAA